MAKAAVKPEIVEEIGADALGESDDEGALQGILAEFDKTDADTNWEIKVYRVTGSARNGATEPFLFYAQPSDFPILEKLRDEWGGGKFRIRVYRNKVLAKRFEFDVEKKPEPKVIAPAQSDLTAILAAMERNNERMIAAIQANRQPQIIQPAQTDPFEMMTRMASAFSGIIAVMQPAQGKSASDLLLAGVELANKLQSGDKETNMMDVVKEAFAALPALQQMADAQRALPPVAPARIPPPATRAAPVQVKPQQTQVITPEQQATEQMRGMLLYLLPKAKKNSDAGFWADYLVEEWGLEMVAAVIAQPNLMIGLQALVPEIVPVTPWFQSLLDELTKLVNDARAASVNQNNAPGKSSSSVYPLPNTGWPGGGEGDFEDDE